MKERPIIFNNEMVRAILDGRKTQTRRVIKGVGPDNWLEGASNHVVHAANKCPYGQPGDRLWVREAFADEGGRQRRDDCYYRADGESDLQGGGWSPSIRMPRWDSRITLEITGVRVERLQEISEADAVAEGCYSNCEYCDNAGDEGLWPCEACRGYQVHGAGSMSGWREVDCTSCDTPRKRFRQLWQSINGPDSWHDNPWVWVVEFKRVEASNA